MSASDDNAPPAPGTGDRRTAIEDATQSWRLGTEAFTLRALEQQ